MFSIRHASDNCTIIDCSISIDDQDWLLGEIDKQREGKTITRFISTHPDQDHLMGLSALDDHIEILNFYVVKNSATKDDETDDFKRYKKLRDGDKAFYIHKGCTRRWMNQSNEERGHSGINVHWPVTSNEDFKQALQDTADGKSPNNISPVITYSLEDGVKMAWFGDLETEFMEKIADEISWPEVDIVFAPHHGPGQRQDSCVDSGADGSQDCGDRRGSVQGPELLSGLQHNNPEFCRLYLLRMRRQLGPHLCWKLNLQRRLSRGQRS